MSRTYSYKPDGKRKSRTRTLESKRVRLEDFEIEFIEMKIGPSIRLGI